MASSKARATSTNGASPPRLTSICPLPAPMETDSNPFCGSPGAPTTTASGDVLHAATACAKAAAKAALGVTPRSAARASIPRRSPASRRRARRTSSGGSPREVAPHERERGRRERPARSRCRRGPERLAAEERRDPRVGLARRLREEALEELGVARDRRLAEQRRVVLDMTAQGRFIALHRQGDVVLRRPGIEVDRRHPRPAQRDRRRHLGLEGEHHLEQRSPAEISLRSNGVDEPLEGDVRVGEHAHRGAAHPREERAEGRVVPEIAAEHKGVYEAPDDALELGGDRAPRWASRRAGPPAR